MAQAQEMEMDRLTGEQQAADATVDDVQQKQRESHHASHDADGSSSHNSELSSAEAAVLDIPRLPKTRMQRRRRRAKERLMHVFPWRRKGRGEGSKSSDDSSNNNNKDLASTTKLLHVIHPAAIPVVNPKTGVPENSNNDSQQDDEESDAFFEENVSRPDFSETFLPLENMAGYPNLERPGEFGKLGILDKLSTISAFDMEMKRTIRLSVPFVTQASITGLTDVVTTAVIGKMVGTREVSAFVIVNLLVGLTSEFVGGFAEALATLCSQAIGSGNHTLAGTYVQIVALLEAACFIPFMVMWTLLIDYALRWFGFDEETVTIGTEYCYILIVDLLFEGVGEAIHGLLDVGGHEQNSTAIGASEEVIACLVLFLVAANGNAGHGLVTVGLIQFGFGILFLFINICFIYWKGWFRPYRKGMIGSFALTNGKAVWLVSKTAMSLSFGMLATDGEWEILTILASAMGPAEVTAWGILDSIWTAATQLIDGFADAGEVRGAFLLGSGQPERAKLSAYKTLMVGSFAAIFMTSCIYICGDDLPTWLTNDPALQHILHDLLPLFGLANFVMSLDTISWTLLGSQGRYRLATIVVCLASWLVTLPLAALFTLALNINLEGLMTAFIIGYLVMGVTHMYLLLRSNWPQLSHTVMEDNKSNMEALVPTRSSTSLTESSKKESQKESQKQLQSASSVGSQSGDLPSSDDEVPTTIS